ncbi:hypothetical protein U9M48_042291 [Paspalum notatum var. saurae]|uniref:Uncharacterized protein n=1 Tax=Paspalum notatum var. saurae TaxID=547442 RepID=A0AAQ3XHF9_PASNO
MGTGPGSEKLGVCPRPRYFLASFLLRLISKPLCDGVSSGLGVLAVGCLLRRWPRRWRMQAMETEDSCPSVPLWKLFVAASHGKGSVSAKQCCRSGSPQSESTLGSFDLLSDCRGATDPPLTLLYFLKKLRAARPHPKKGRLEVSMLYAQKCRPLGGSSGSIEAHTTVDLMTDWLLVARVCCAQRGSERILSGGFAPCS